jgi:hypothetical protein
MCGTWSRDVLEVLFIKNALAEELMVGFFCSLAAGVITGIVIPYGYSRRLGFWHIVLSDCARYVVD